MEQVLDEADRLLGEEFQKPTNEILKVIPRGGEQRTYLFSATMTNKVYLNTSVDRNADTISIVYHRMLCNESCKVMLIGTYI